MLPVSQGHDKHPTTLNVLPRRGLLIAEATVISRDAGGNKYASCIYADAQTQGWKNVRTFYLHIRNPSCDV